MNFTWEITQIGLWISGLSAITIAWIAYSIVMFFLNRKKMEELRKIKGELDEIHKKLDKLIREK